MAESNSGLTVRRDTFIQMDLAEQILVLYDYMNEAFKELEKTEHDAQVRAERAAIEAAEGAIRKKKRLDPLWAALGGIIGGAITVFLYIEFFSQIVAHVGAK